MADNKSTPPEETWTVVMEGATDALDTLQTRFDGDPQLALAALALAMSYLMTMTNTPEDRRHALYDCVEDRVNDAAVTLELLANDPTTLEQTDLQKLMVHLSASKVVH